MNSQQVQLLIDDVVSRTGDSPTEYTKGYLDALEYIFDCLEEDSDE